MSVHILHETLQWNCCITVCPPTYVSLCTEHTCSPLPYDHPTINANWIASSTVVLFYCIRIIVYWIYNSLMVAVQHVVGVTSSHCAAIGFFCLLHLHYYYRKQPPLRQLLSCCIHIILQHQLLCTATLLLCILGIFSSGNSTLFVVSERELHWRLWQGSWIFGRLWWIVFDLSLDITEVPEGQVNKCVLFSSFKPNHHGSCVGLSVNSINSAFKSAYIQQSSVV